MIVSSIGFHVAVVPRLPVVHRQVDGRAELPRSSQRPAFGRLEQRHFLDAGVRAADEYAEGVRGRRLGDGLVRAGSQKERTQQR